MAVVLRRNTGTALTFDQLDDNFVDYTTFRDKFDQSEWIGSGDAKLLYFDNNTGKIKIKELTDDDLNIGAFNTNFNTRFAGKTTADLSEGSNLYYTSARANADFDTRLATKSTTNLSEGSNLYYTDARVDARIGLTSLTVHNDVPNTLSSDDSKVIMYDAQSDSFKYSSLITEKLIPVTNYGSITDSNVITGGAGVTTTSLQSLSNVNYSSVDNAVNENVLFYNGSEWVAGVITVTGNVRDNGVTTFPAMTDTPANYTGSAGKFTKVKSGEDGLEFATPSTDDLTEGTAKFYSDSRFDTRLSAKSTDDLTEGSSNLYYTNARADSRVALHVGANLNLGSKTTTDLAEGTNLYYTDARANTAFDTKIGTTTLGNLNDITAPAGPSDNGKLLMYFNNGVDPATYRLQSFSDTDALPEGSTNEYYTETKVDNRIANRLEGNVRMRLPSYTTSARDSLTGVVNGEMIYNTTVNKIQGYENGSWKDLSTVYG